MCAAASGKLSAICSINSKVLGTLYSNILYKTKGYCTVLLLNFFYCILGIARKIMIFMKMVSEVLSNYVYMAVILMCVVNTVDSSAGVLSNGMSAMSGMDIQILSEVS